MFLLLVYTGTKNVYVRSEVPVTYGIRYQFQNQIRIKYLSLGSGSVFEIRIHILNFYTIFHILPVFFRRQKHVISLPLYCKKKKMSIYIHT